MALCLLPMWVFPRQDRFSALNTGKMQPWVLVGHFVFRSFLTFEKIPCHAPLRHCLQKVHCAMAEMQTMLHRAGDTGFEQQSPMREWSCHSASDGKWVSQPTCILPAIRRIYTHTYIKKYIYMHFMVKHKYTHTYIYIFIYTYICIYTYVYLCILFRNKRLWSRRCCDAVHMHVRGWEWVKNIIWTLEMLPIWFSVKNNTVFIKFQKRVERQLENNDLRLS